MECPYCLEDFNEEALVCKDCGRDLRLVRPVINENLRLVALAMDLEDQVHKARTAVARATAPFTFWATHCVVYILLPIILLIAAHFLIVVTLDVSPLFLRLASIAIPLPFGLLVIWRSHHGIEWAIGDGIVIGLLAVTGMLIAVAVIDNVPVLPDNARDWRETLEYVASIALANITGAVLAIFLRRMLPRTLDATGAPSAAAVTIARIAGRQVGTQALRRRAQKIQDNFQTVATGAAALGAGASSLYTGIRALVGF